MSGNVAQVLCLSTQCGSEDEPVSPLWELFAARYVDREISSARATAEMCNGVAARARAQGMTLIAGVLCEFERAFNDEAAFLAPATLPDVQWPWRSRWRVADDAPVDESLETLHDALQHSVRTLRWIARRPDFPVLARVTFDALASAREARHQLLLACRAIEP